MAIVVTIVHAGYVFLERQLHRHQGKSHKPPERRTQVEYPTPCVVFLETQTQERTAEHGYRDWQTRILLPISLQTPVPGLQSFLRSGAISQNLSGIEGELSGCQRDRFLLLHYIPNRQRTGLSCVESKETRLWHRESHG
jgi:hypothetical protein